MELNENGRFERKKKEALRKNKAFVKRVWILFFLSFSIFRFGLKFLFWLFDFSLSSAVEEACG